MLSLLAYSSTLSRMAHNNNLARCHYILRRNSDLKCDFDLKRSLLFVSLFLADGLWTLV